MLDYIFKTGAKPASIYGKTQPNPVPTEGTRLTPKTTRQRFEDRSLRLLNTSGSSDPIIQSIFDGNIANIESAFFPKQANEETALMREMIHSLILEDQNPRHKVQFFIDNENKTYQFEFKGKRYDLYPFLTKIKWDLIELDSKELEEYGRKSLRGKYTISYSSVPSIHAKEHLYAKLHYAEKMAIGVYKYSGFDLNRFLRGGLYLPSEKTFKDYLIHTAALCSALNRIPPSVNGYLYRCMTDYSKSSESESLVNGMARKLKVGEKFKEAGFTSMSMHKPLDGFGKDCIKIYTNPFKLAKDISGIAGFEDEFECLLLPNTKDLALREIVEDKSATSIWGPKVSHYIITKLVSKRQGLF